MLGSRLQPVTIHRGEEIKTDSKTSSMTKKRKRALQKSCEEALIEFLFAQLPGMIPIESKQSAPSRLQTVCTDPRIRIGTSGYMFAHWNDGKHCAYYPKATKGQVRDFEYYAGEFDSVELNTTYYNMPAEKVFKSWKARADAIRPSFTYTIKAWKYFTHMKKLIADDDFKDRWRTFVGRCQLLGTHLGPILLQFPPSFECDENNLNRLKDFGKVTRCHAVKLVFEFRDPSWFVPKVYDVIKENNWCLAIIDICNTGHLAGWCGKMTNGTWPLSAVQTCNWGMYYRFHGTTGQYVGVYGRERAVQLAQDLQVALLNPGFAIYCYYNNTDSHSPPAAIQDCRHMTNVLNECLKV